MTKLKVYIGYPKNKNHLTLYSNASILYLAEHLWVCNPSTPLQDVYAKIKDATPLYLSNYMGEPDSAYHILGENLHFDILKLRFLVAELSKNRIKVVLR